jgi:hypothetical protein
MKAEELRLGNLVNDRLGLITIGMECGVRFADTYKPIPLTKQWFKKFQIKEGIEIDDGEIGVYWGSNPHDYRFIDKDLSPKNYKCNVYVYSGLGSYSDYAAIIQCNYVHTLQNLYFALTGTELELKK